MTPRILLLIVSVPGIFLAAYGLYFAGIALLGLRRHLSYPKACAYYSIKKDVSLFHYHHAKKIMKKIFCKKYITSCFSILPNLLHLI